MKCISSALALVATVAPLASATVTGSFKHVTLANGESRVLSGASFSNLNNIKQDAGPMTMATDTKPSVTNGGVNLYPYSSDIQQYIVAAHNNARATMVPSTAANMRQLSWDESLAIEASELVNTCVFEHDTENYAYGQNLMYGGFSITTSVVDSWMDAWVKQELSPSDRAGTGFLDLDHASAVLWANSYMVGCASKMCPNGYLTACNYFSPGNWQGEQAYIPGTPCSQCPTQAPYCDATGKLCTASKVSTPTQAPAPAPVPVPTVPGPAPVPVPGPTPAKTVPAPTPASTTGSPIQQQDQATQSPSDNQTGDFGMPTPAATWTSGNSLSGSADMDSPIQRPVGTTPSADSVDTPAPTDKWSNVESSPATKPVLPGAIAALVGALALARVL